MKRLFLDLGAHKGNDTAFYLDHGWRAVAVEAHPELARAATQRFHLQIGDCRILHRAITEDGKPGKLFASDKGPRGETHSIQSHRVKRPEGVPHYVEGTTVQYLLKTYGVPDYMKVDIEGCDVVAIRQLHAWANIGAMLPKNLLLPHHLSVELCPEHPEEALEIFSHLAYMGYDRFDLVRQHWDETVDVDAVDYRMGLNEAASWWFNIKPSPDVWYDLHALHSSVEEGIIPAEGQPFANQFKHTKDSLNGKP